MDVSTIARFEPEKYELLLKNCTSERLPTKVYFNKGL